jgi:hypothetical protein
MPRTPYSTAIYLVLVFGSGALVGVVSHRLYETGSVNANSAAPRTSAEFRQRYFAEMRKWGVNEEQIGRIRIVLDDSKKQFDELHAKEKPLRDKIQQDHVEAVRAILTESQRAQYDKWREERERRRTGPQNQKTPSN